MHLAEFFCIINKRKYAAKHNSLMSYHPVKRTEWWWFMQS